MARTHPFAETGARPKPHATEGVTAASMPPATQAGEDEMMVAAGSVRHLQPDVRAKPVR